jgi:hypothetical protein
VSPLPQPQTAFFDNLKRVDSNIFRSHPTKFTQNFPWRGSRKANPDHSSSISPKKRKLVLIDEMLHAPSKLLRESKSTECPTPKELTNPFSGSISKFQIIRILGKGRFGEVYLARYIPSHSGTEEQVLSVL